jgi:hypothetical protein
MPTTRVPLTREPVMLTEMQWRHLVDAEEPSESEGGDPLGRLLLDEAGELWAAHRERVLSLWAREHPGTRPSLWWRWDAPRMRPETWPLGSGTVWIRELPEPRRRLGGTGTPSYEVLATVPYLDHGVPRSWLTQGLKPWFSTTAPAYDPDDPPVYESQAAYLERHGLLLPGERRRLTGEDFEAERVIYDEPAA